LAEKAKKKKPETPYDVMAELLKPKPKKKEESEHLEK